MKRNPCAAFSPGVILALIGGYPLCAHSQAAPPADTQTLQTIIVTAEYRPERLDDVPAAISALTESELQDLGAHSVSDFAALVPGLTFSSLGAGTNTLILRGINTGGLEVTSLVGVLLDGVPFGSSSSFAQGGTNSLDASLWDMQRVEVLRGPQGTLYGANAMTGLISYVYRSPDLDRYETLGEAGASSTEHGGMNYAIRGAVNLPLVTDALALRLSASHENDAGYIDNPALGKRGINGDRSDTARAALLFKPGDSLSVQLEGIYQRTVRDGENQVLYSTITYRPIAGALDTTQGLLNPATYDFKMGALTVNYAFGPATLTSITSYQEVKGDVDIDYTGTPTGTALQALGAANTSADVLNSTKKFTQELRLASRNEGAFRYLAGFFYTDERSADPQILDGFLASGAPFPLNPLLTIAIPSTYREYAFFAQDTYVVTPKLFLTAGVRYNHDEQSFSQSNGGLLEALLTPVPTTSAGEGEENYLFTARYALSRDSNVYVRASSGYRPGGPNVAIKGSPAGQSFAPDRLWNYETGYKTAWLDGRANLQADVFYIAWSNIQLIGEYQGFAYRANGAHADSKGLEAQSTFIPFQGMTVGANLALTDAKLTGCLQVLNGTCFSAPDVSGADGERLPYSPRWSGVLFADYHFPISSDWTGFAGTTVQAVGNRTESFDASQGVPQFFLGSYVIGDIRAGIDDGGWKITAYVHNVTDKRAEYSALTNYGTVPRQALVAIAQPRTVGVTLDVSL